MAKAKKTGLGDNPLDWIRDTSQPESETSEVPEFETSEVKKFKTSKDRKSKTSEVPKLSTSGGPKFKALETPKSKTSEVAKFVTSEVPKFLTFEKLSILIREDQLDLLTRLERSILRSRDKAHRKERITKNSILRAYIDALAELDLDLENISDEEELLRRIKEKLGI
jgi:hypothetical protein